MVVAFKSGDSHAYALIYREYRPLAESICLRILGNPEDAAEAAQETMLRVFQGLPRFNGRYLLRAWVSRIATNVCLDVIRRRSRRPDEIGSPEPEQLEADDRTELRTASEDPGEVVARVQEHERVRSLLGELPAHHREALVMREWDGLSHEQIGEHLGMTAPQVKALLHRAKKGFKRAWEVESGRASVFAWPALVVPLRWLKKLFAPARDVVGEVTTTASAQVIQLAASPVVVQAGNAAGERVAAAAGAILVAGTIGIGAATLPGKVRPAPKSIRPAVTVIDDGPTRGPVALRQKPDDVVPSINTDPTGGPIEGAALVQRRRPTTDVPSPSPEPTPVPTPSGEVPSEPTPTEEPTVPPAPGFTMSFTSTSRSSQACGCEGQTGLTHSNSPTGRPGGNYRFEQGSTSPGYDADGDAAWKVNASYKGEVQGSSGTLTLNFTFMTGAGTSSYQGQQSLQSVKHVGEHEWVYVFTGAYDYMGGASNESDVPRRGHVKTTLRVWADGTIFGAAFHLS